MAGKIYCRNRWLIFVQSGVSKYNTTCKYKFNDTLFITTTNNDSVLNPYHDVTIYLPRTKSQKDEGQEVALLQLQLTRYKQYSYYSTNAACLLLSA